MCFLREVAGSYTWGHMLTEPMESFSNVLFFFKKLRDDELDWNKMFCDKHTRFINQLHARADPVTARSIDRVSSLQDMFSPRWNFWWWLPAQISLRHLGCKPKIYYQHKPSGEVINSNPQIQMQIQRSKNRPVKLLIQIHKYKCWYKWAQITRWSY